MIPSNKFIKKIIKEESTEKIIREQFSDDPNTFSTQIDDVDFSGLRQYFPEYQDRDMDIAYLDCVVNWRYDLDVRSWGIKDISVYTTSVVIRGTIEIYDEDYTGVEVEKEIELYVDDMGGFQRDDSDTWHYEDEKDNERYHTILPTHLQIDLEDKSVVVGWN